MWQRRNEIGQEVTANTVVGDGQREREHLITEMSGQDRNQVAEHLCAVALDFAGRS